MLINVRSLSGFGFCATLAAAINIGSTNYQVLYGVAPYAHFGAAIFPVGDIDRDGFVDFAVGSPSDTGSPDNRPGRIDVFSGCSGQRIWGRYGIWMQDDNHFGASVSGAGDMNGDRIPDVVVGGPQEQPYQLAYVQILSGVSGEEILTINAPPYHHRFGSSVRSLDDVTGDGKSEIVVAESYRGIFVYSGESATLLWSFNISWPERITSLEIVGDLNGDAVSDLLACNYFDQAPKVRALSGADGQVLWVLTGNYGQAFGASVSGIGDVDGDRRDDVAIGSPGTNANRGEVSIYSGNDGTLLGVLRHPGSFVSRFGGGVAGKADVLQGNGELELLVTGVSGSTKYVFVFGVTSRQLLKQHIVPVGHSPIAVLGNVGGNKADDFAIGDPNYSGPAGFFSGAIYVGRGR